MGLLDDLAGAKSTPQIKSDAEHYEASGRFLTWFANAESAVHVLARRLSGLPDSKARIIFGGMRLADLTDIVRQMARIDHIPETQYAEIDACLTQLNYIGTKRHSLVHRSSNFFDGKLMVTNIMTSKKLSSSEMEVFEFELITNMITDCSRILLRLHYVAEPERFSEVELATLQTMKREPWRYKHTPPKAPNLKVRDKASRPERASSASRRREALKRTEKS